MKTSNIILIGIQFIFIFGVLITPTMFYECLNFSLGYYVTMIFFLVCLNVTTHILALNSNKQEKCCLVEKDEN